MLPALHHILGSTDNDSEVTPALPIAMDYYMGIHTHCYNYFSTQSNSPTGSNESRSIHMKELYEKLDEHFAYAARNLFTSAPDNAALVQYITAWFKRYSTGARSIRRLLNYLDDNYVLPATKEGKGWFDDDMVDMVAKTSAGYFATRKNPRIEELKKWGYKKGGPAELSARAEASAEAASTLNCVVPLSSLLLRRFRLEFIEPLLQAPAVNEKDKNQIWLVLELKPKVSLPALWSKCKGQKELTRMQIEGY
jgi:hypothetical protein